MPKKIDLIGKIVGKWTVLKLDDSNMDRRYVRWICRCECGSEASLISNTLIHTKTTKCLNCKYKEFPFGEFPSALWSQIKCGAKSRKLDFNLTKEYLLTLFKKQGGKCSLSGRDIVLGNRKSKHSYKECTASLDRIDSSKGYIEGNVQWIHKDYQPMKWNYSQERFFELCETVTKYRKQV